MNVYVIRHGDYAASDPRQGLTAKGAADMRAAGVFLKEIGVSAGSIWHSSKTRARESARILGDVLGVMPLEEKMCLLPDAPPGGVVAELSDSQEDGDHLLVTHMPLIPRLLNHLFPGQSKQAVVQTASVTLLTRGSRGWESFRILKNGV